MMIAGTTNMLIEPLSATSLTRKRVFTLGLLWLFQMIPAMSKELSQLPIQVGLGTCCPCEASFCECRGSSWSHVSSSAAPNII
eukprot:349547-Hanusia_phi.AAC.4